MVQLRWWLKRGATYVACMSNTCQATTLSLVTCVGGANGPPCCSSSLLAVYDGDFGAHLSWVARLGVVARSTRMRPSGSCKETSRCVVQAGSATIPHRSLWFRVGRVACQARNHRLMCETVAESCEIENLLMFMSLPRWQLA
jgi:hypothetical protein